jgi:hypothetical protein
MAVLALIHFRSFLSPLQVQESRSSTVYHTVITKYGSAALTVRSLFSVVTLDTLDNTAALIGQSIVFED